MTGLATGLTLALYNLLVFGSATHLGYSDTVNFPEVHRGIIGVSIPRPGVLLELLVGTHRGLLLVAPLLALVPLGWLAGVRRWQTSTMALVVTVPATFLLINAGFAYWDAGASTGPRYVAPSLPFLALALVPLWDCAGRALRGVLLITALVSFTLSLICAATDMTAPTSVKAPLTDSVLPRFFAGDLHNIMFLAGGAGWAWLILLPLAWVAVVRLVGLLRWPQPAASAPHAC
jgi:hypothetical protein